MSTTSKDLSPAAYGSKAVAHLTGQLPNPFPRTMGPNALTYVTEVIDSGLVVDMVTRFETAFAQKNGIRNVIATPGCTNAIMLLAEALDFDAGDEVIVSPITDYGTLMGFVKKGYIPVFPDTDPGSPNMSAATIAPHITDRTRAIMCVHKMGIPCDMDPIIELARKHNLVVIEDVCQAVLGRYKGRILGTLGDAAVFSFDAEKTMGSDIGGAMATNDDDLAYRARFLGQSRGAVDDPPYGRRHAEAGQALRMPNCTAAVSLAQLEIIEDQVAHLDAMIRLLNAKLGEIPGIIPNAIPDYCDVASMWMAGFSLQPGAFTVGALEFGQRCAELGLTGASWAPYYLVPDACTFLDRDAQAKVYPYSTPPASRAYRYRVEDYPNATAFLNNWVRWATFCEKYQPEDCQLAADIVRAVAEELRVR